MDYGDVIYNRPSNESFLANIKTVQCNLSLIIAGAIKAESCEKLHQVLRLVNFRQTRSIRRLSVL